ncbi:MAG TPA: hypothetical protein PLA07_08985 [Sulfuricurvum sp.]|nr:hypothetical protein [Sulfuricurvum sp.]
MALIQIGLILIIIAIFFKWAANYLQQLNKKEVLGTFNYRGHIGSIQYSQEDKVFWGKLEGIDALVTFEANSTEELELNFIKTVDNYLSLCSK